MIRFGKSSETHYFDKMQNHKQIRMKSSIFLKKYGQFVPEPGMLWNLSIFSKLDFEMFLISLPYGFYEPGMWWYLDIFCKFALEIRMDSWYLWKTHFLNFWHFQESPNPSKYRFPPLHQIGVVP